MVSRLALVLALVLLATAPSHAEKAAPEPPKSAAQTRQKAVADLLAGLRQAPDAETAVHIRAAITRIWGRSGSPTADLLMARSEVLLHAGKALEAAELLDRIVTLYPDWTQGWRRRAQSALMRGDGEGAMLDLHHALGVEPRDFLAMEELAKLLRAEGRDGPALDLMRRALEIDPQDAELRVEVERLQRKVEGERI